MFKSLNFQNVVPIPRIGTGKSVRARHLGSQHCLLSAIQEGQAFRLAGGYIGEWQGIQVADLDAGATVDAPVPLEDKPGWASLHSAKVRIGSCCLSMIPARVVKRLH
jgi:hypothetical protein